MAGEKNPKGQAEEKPKAADPAPVKPQVNPTAKEHWKKGNSFFEEGKFDDAIREYNEALTVEPKYADAYFNRALTHRVQNNFSAAKKDLEVVMELQPKSADAPLLIGDISESNNDFIGARFWYEKSLANNPDYAEAKNRLERIDSLIHIDSKLPKKPAGGSEQSAKQVQKFAEPEEKIEEGQIKKLAFYKSNVRFDSVIGLTKAKKYLTDNVVLAIKQPELFRKYGKKLGVGLLLYGPPGVGKCVAANTDVLLPDGRCMKIKDVVDRKEPYILTLTKMHKLGVSRVSGWWKLEGKPLLRITTDRGRVVDCTPEHPLLTKSGWSPAETFSVGERIGVPRSLSVFGNSLMKESEVKLLAYFIAEGGLTQGMPVFTNGDLELLEDFKSAVAQYDDSLHFNVRMDHGNSATLQVAGRHMHERNTWERSTMQQFLDKHGLSFTSSYTKKIPEHVFTLQKHLLALFLNRLFSGEGWAEKRVLPPIPYGPREKRVIGYASMSETLIRQVQHLLLRFGILSNIRHRQESGAWELTVHRNRDVDTFIDEIGMFGAKAQLLSKKKNNWSKIKKKGGNRVVYERIKSIEKIASPEFVYDLTVDETHNFVANDFFVHNTHVVNAIAGESGANVLIARLNQIVDMYTGNTEKNLHAIFDQARKNAPCIIFFDELDALGAKRGGGGGEGGDSQAMRLAVNQFLVEMNGLESNPEGIFVIGATNQPWDIDPALKRSGRFGDSLYIKPPTYKDRKALFEFYTRNKPRKGVNYGRLARCTTGYSPADIERITDKSAMLPLLHEYQMHKARNLTMKDIMSVLKDKDFSGSSLDEWYQMVKKDVISKTETQMVDGKKQEIVKEGKLDAQEKILYKTMVNDIKKNTRGLNISAKRFVRWWGLHFF
ncbi:MAG: AAA family ATPase [Candidatus Micrarchaeota archaeon]|nr:AAA family ATPase [Candidatus Micrarchaeota archaeon]